MSVDMGKSTMGGPRHVVLPFKALMLGPNSLLLIITSRGVTGQLGRLLALRILMKSLSNGRLTVTCNSHAPTAQR